jgi:Fe2+ or Zn2+ uptake regulation protein
VHYHVVQRLFSEGGTKVDEKHEHEHHVKCSACGEMLTAGDEDALVAKLQEHAKHDHGKDMPDAKAREAVKQGHT